MAKDKLSIKRIKLFQSIFFGSYPNEVGKIDSIEWQVIAKEDDKILLLSRYILDVKRYDEGYNEWKECELNKWLNGEFYENAFNVGEKLKIVADTETGCNVFILSHDQAETLLSQQQRDKKPTPYAFAVEDKLRFSYHGRAWWMRDAVGLYEAKRTFEGFLHYKLYVNMYCGVVPAVWVKILNK